jgi:hypothetical protein
MDKSPKRRCNRIYSIIVPILLPNLICVCRGLYLYQYSTYSQKIACCVCLMDNKARNRFYIPLLPHIILLHNIILHTHHTRSETLSHPEEAVLMSFSMSSVKLVRVCCKLLYYTCQCVAHQSICLLRDLKNK